MATFEAQVEGLTGLSIDGSSAPTQTELTQFLTDGAKEVINLLPENLLPLCTSSVSFTSGSASTLNTGKVLHVLRSDGDISQPCRSILAMYKGKYSDSDDMNYATVTDPVFYVENNTIDVLPAGGSCTYSEVQYPSVSYGDSLIGATSLTGVTATAVDPTVFTKSSHGLSTGDIVKLSNFTEMIEINGMTGTVTKLDANTFEVNGVSADPAETTGGNVVKLGGFPDEAEYLVPLYASMKSLQNAMGNKTSDLPSDITFPSIPILIIPSMATVGDLTLPVTPTAPSLSAQSVTITGTAPTYLKPTLSSQTAFNDYWAIGDFPDSDPGALAVNAVAPSVPSISAASVTITGTAPTYVGPSYSQIDTYIDTDEDVELAQAKLQEVSNQVQDSLNRFNDDNVEYQAKLQKDIQDAQLESTEEGQKLQKYSAELQNYQANVSKEVQEYQQKLSRYQLELGTVYQAWAKTESDNLSKYQSDIQNELNTFNDSNVEYQAKLQKDIQDAQLSDTNEARKLQKYSSEVQTYSAEVSARVQEWVNEEWNQSFQKYQQDYSSRLQEYSNDIQSYQAEVGKSVQDFNTKLQKHTADYGWLQSQYQQLSADYQRGIQLLRGGPAPQ